MSAAVSSSASAPLLARRSEVSAPSRVGGVLQRKCACGGNALAGGECEECRKRKLQRKFAIGSTTDPLEREADQLAEQVLSAPAPGISGRSPVRVQRFTGGAKADAGIAPSSVDRVLASPGQPLRRELREDMESRFGQDFSRVRIHTDTEAAQSARDVNARAYTVGREVVFGAGQFAPASPGGRKLLAHELAHTIQQCGGANAPNVDEPFSLHESTAREATHGAAVGQKLRWSLRPAGIGLSRSPNADDERAKAVAEAEAALAKMEEDERESAKEDEGKSVVRSAGPRTCPGGAMPYNGVCLTGEILDVLPAVGDVQAAERIVKANAAEKRAQARVAEKYSKMSDAELNRKIDEMRESVERNGQAGSIPLRRLQKERDRRRALPISQPTGVDQAIAMLEEAWSLAEKEHPPDLRRASYLVRVVNTWLQKAAPPSRYGECFSGMAQTTAMTSVGMAKGNVNDLDHKFRLGASIGGWWPATINSLKAARELVQIMSGEKRIEETEFNEISKAINRSVLTTPPKIAAAAVGGGLLGFAGAGGAALPATIQGVQTAVWLKTFAGAAISSSYLGHVVTRSKEAAETEGGSNPISIVSTALLDTSGIGNVSEAIENESLLTGKPLHLSKGERVAKGIIGGLEFALNFFGAKDLFGDPVPQVKTPRRVATEPQPEQPAGPAHPDQGLAEMGVRPAPGTRSQTREEYQIQSRAERRARQSPDVRERVEAIERADRAAQGLPNKPPKTASLEDASFKHTPTEVQEALNRAQLPKSDAQLPKLYAKAMAALNNPRLLRKVARDLVIEELRLRKIPMTQPSGRPNISSGQRAIESLVERELGPMSQLREAGQGKVVVSRPRQPDSPPKPFTESGVQYEGSPFLDLPLAGTPHGSHTHGFQMLVLRRALARSGVNVKEFFQMIGRLGNTRMPGSPKTFEAAGFDVPGTLKQAAWDTLMDRFVQNGPHLNSPEAVNNFLQKVFSTPGQDY
jgi:hypothetical protein